MELLNLMPKMKFISEFVFYVAWALVNENYEVVHNSDITFVEYIKQDNCVHIKKVNSSIYSVDGWHVRAFFLRTKITKEETANG